MSEHFRYEEQASYWTNPSDLQWLAERPIASAVRVRYVPMTTDYLKPGAIMLEMPPGYTIVRHSHPCARVEIVIRGSLQTTEGSFGPGDVMTAKPGEAYGPHTAGPEGCLTVEFFERMEASWHTTFEDEVQT